MALGVQESKNPMLKKKKMYAKFYYLIINPVSFPIDTANLVSLDPSAMLRKLEQRGRPHIWIGEKGILNKRELNKRCPTMVTKSNTALGQKT